MTTYYFPKKNKKLRGKDEYTHYQKPPWADPKKRGRWRRHDLITGEIKLWKPEHWYWEEEGDTHNE